MSATLKEIAYNILNSYRGGRSTNNEHISLRQIMFNVKHYRAMLLRRDFERNGMISRHVEQDLGCIELELVNASKCCGLPVDCVVARTKVPLPRAIRFNRHDAITHVADVTGLHTIPMVDPNTVQWLPYDRPTKNERKAYMIEDHMYIYNPDGLDIINIRGIFEDPEEVAQFDCGGAKCYDLDGPFPMSLDMISILTEGILKGSMPLLMQSESDTEQDQMDAKDMNQKVQQGGGQRN